MHKEVKRIVPTRNYMHRLAQTVQPSMSCSGDFALWQAAAKEKLGELLGIHRFEKADPQTYIEYETKTEGATEIRFLFDSEEGYTVPCHMLLPDGVKNPPVMICLQGHTSGMHISLGRKKYRCDDGFQKYTNAFCLQAVKEGFAAVAMEQRNFGELAGDPDGYTLCHHEAGIATMMGRTTIGERVWDIRRLIDVLEQEFSDRIDTDTICCMGNSGGGTATAYAAIFEDRLKLVVPSCAMASFRDSIGSMYHCPCNYVPHIAEYFDMGDIMAMAYPKYFIQVSGDEDPIFPFPAAREVYEQGSRIYAQQGGGDRCALVVGHGGHDFYPEEAWPVVQKYLSRIRFEVKP